MPAIQAVSSQQDTDDIIAYLRTTYPSQNQGGGDTNGGNPGDSGNNGGSEVDGEELVNIHCNSCHVNGYAPSFGSLMPYMGLSEVEDAIINGTSGGMPSFQFSQEELNAITFYLSDEFGN